METTPNVSETTSITSSVWQKSKLLIKGFMIAGLVLLLLIPSYFVQELIKEREARQKEAFAEVSSKWAGRQNLTGPVLVVPYIESPNQSGSAKHYAYFLPDELTIDARVQPEERHRGI